MAAPLPRSLAAIVIAAGLGLVPQTGVAQSASAPAQLDALLARVGEYMQVFVDDLSNVFLIFRDVLEVNGRPVRDQQERVLKLFAEPFQDAVRRAGQIEREAARHSLERGRVMNPLDLAAFLQTPYQQNFTFSLRGSEPSLGPDVREIELEQRIEPGTRQIPVRGAAWVSQALGRVVKTELRIGTGAAMRFTTTTFGRDPGLKIDVPLEMHDRVPTPVDDEFHGEARYSNFRRFQVSAKQQVELPANRVPGRLKAAGPPFDTGAD